MAVRAFENITRYFVFLEQSNRNYLGNITVRTMAQIKCLTEAGEGIWFVFINDPDIPNPYYNENNKELMVFRPASTYAYYLDLLRNEKPLRLIFNDATLLVQLMTSTLEPVGEGPGEVV